MLGFRKLDVYQCALGRCDDDQRQFYRVARGSALECGAVLDAMRALGLVTDDETAPLEELLVRIVAMLTRMSAP